MKCFIETGHIELKKNSKFFQFTIKPIFPDGIDSNLSNCFSSFKITEGGLVLYVDSKIAGVTEDMTLTQAVETAKSYLMAEMGLIEIV